MFWVIYLNEKIFWWHFILILNFIQFLFFFFLITKYFIWMSVTLSENISSTLILILHLVLHVSHCYRATKKHSAVSWFTWTNPWWVTQIKSECHLKLMSPVGSQVDCWWVCNNRQDHCCVAYTYTHKCHMHHGVEQGDCHRVTVCTFSSVKLTLQSQWQGWEQWVSSGLQIKKKGVSNK